MEDLFDWLLKLGPKTSVMMVVSILIITALIKSQTIIDIFKWFKKKKAIRSCGDCLLILFGIREKNEYEIQNIERNILRSQMNYFEQKSQEVILWLTQSFQDDLDRIGSQAPESLKIAQLGNYHESLKNAMKCVQDDMRRSFKENGFCELADNEYSNYVKSKTRTFISIVQSYLSTYYTNCEPIVSLKYRIDKFDSSRLFDIAFDIFGYAKLIIKEAEEKQRVLKLEMRKEIDSFIENPVSR